MLAAWTAALLVPAAPLPPQKPADPNQPKLLSRGKDFVVHALPAIPVVDDLQRFVGRAPTGRAMGLVIAHTSLATGEMRYIAHGARTSFQGPPMGIDRMYHQLTVIAGVAVDDQRIYVLCWHSSVEEMMLGRPMAPPSFEKGTYTLKVFQARDGVTCQEIKLEKGDFPKTPPADTPDKGPLHLRDSGVDCFGVMFTFKGTELLKQQYQKNP